jgi:phage/plasmid-like protein (TIGR03299 family)
MSTDTKQYARQGFLIGQTNISSDGLHAVKHGLYPGFIPIEDVKPLFDWEPVSRTPEYPALVTDSGIIMDHHVDITKQTMWRPPGVFGPEDSGAPLGHFGAGSYKAHSYMKWCIENVFSIIDDPGIGINSAALLNEGAVAAVTISVPKTVVTKTGVEFLPNLIAATSLNGSIASSYVASRIKPVCRNTLMAGLKGNVAYRLKHTKNSEFKIHDAQEALGIMYASSDEFSAQIDKLVETKKTDRQFDKFVDAWANVDGAKRKKMVEDRRLALRRMYESDPRVVEWKGTAYGILQAVNTWWHHEQPTRGDTNRIERNIFRSINGDTEKMDAKVLQLLNVS